jgi:hypothetical protein
MGRAWGRRERERSPKQIWSEWMAANDAGDPDRAGRLAAEMVTAAPDASGAWFEAALYSKARGRWQEAAERNERAVALFTSADSEAYEAANPAAWNLGIAATALGDWARARAAWRAYGIPNMDEGAEPIDVDYGMAPIRLNPDRPSLAHQVLPELGTTEVVWCWRRSPAHAVVASVPLPESGHRFRDVVLHDGEPKGTRNLGGREVSVFDELALLESSGLATWQVHVSGASRADLDDLGDLMGSRGLGVDEWSGMRMMCSACSHGSPDADHVHEPPDSDVARLGLAGAEGELRDCLDVWRSERPEAEILDLELLL